MRGKMLVCALCGKGGGTMVNDPELGKVHQGRDCARAASLLERLEKRVAKILKARREGRAT